MDAMVIFARFDWKVEALVDHMYVSKSMGKDEYELRLTDPDQVRKMLQGYKSKKMNLNDSASNVNDS